MRRKVRRWVVWCVAIVAAGCGPSPVQVTGQWTGTMTEVVNQWNGSFSFNLSQSGENVSGAWIASNNPNVGGPVSGKVESALRSRSSSARTWPATAATRSTPG